MDHLFLLEDSDERIAVFELTFPGIRVFKDPNAFLREVHSAFQERPDDGFLLCLDHDLQFFEFHPYKVEVTGEHVVRDLVSSPIPSGVRVVIHSHNPVGAQNMRSLLRNAGIPVQWFPFKGEGGLPW